ncbi:hypothetical protein ACJJTC_019466 [Scirpophaga incertulas]
MDPGARFWVTCAMSIWVYMALVDLLNHPKGRLCTRFYRYRLCERERQEQVALPKALPNEPKLGPPRPNSSRDNQPPNLYSVWLKPDISRTTSPRPPVLGLPVEGVTSSTSRVSFPGMIFATTEATRNLCDPAEEAGG